VLHIETKFIRHNFLVNLSWYYFGF